MRKKWYVISQSADDDEYSIIELTSRQAATFRYIMENRKPVYGGGYCGTTYMYEESFNTYDEALEFALRQSY